MIIILDDSSHKTILGQVVDVRRWIFNIRYSYGNFPFKKVISSLYRALVNLIWKKFQKKNYEVFLSKIAQVCILKSCLKHLGYCFFRIDMCREIHLNRKISHTKRSPNDAISTDFYHTLIFLIGNRKKKSEIVYR